MLWALLCGLLIPADGLVDLIVAVLLALALGIRRWSPGIALAVAWLGAIVQMVGLQPPHFVDLAVLPVLYATRLVRRPSCAGSG